MRIILLAFIPFLVGLFPANSPELSKTTKGAPLLIDAMTINADISTITGEFCDHETNGDFPVEGFTARLTEIGSGTVYEDVSDNNGAFTLTKPVDGPISYEGILPTRYLTDATLSSPRFGVSTFDLVLLSKYVAGIDNMCSYTRFAADLDRDGTITVADVDEVRNLILFLSGVATNPYPNNLWRLVPKLPSVPSYFHPDQQFLADYWNNALVQNSVGLFPFAAELDLANDTYVYQNGACNYVDDVIKRWEYRENVDGCSPNSFDFTLGKIGDFNNSLQGEYLDGTTSDKFSITCSTNDSEGFYEVIPFGGGFVGVGFAESNTAGNDQDVLVVRMNQYGEPLWAKTVGGAGDDKARTVIETTDGNLFITGDTKSVTPTRADVYILKMDPSGNVLWENSFNGNDESNQYDGMVAKGRQTPDGGYVIGARTQNFGQGLLDYYIIKVNASGVLQWSKVIGGSNNDWPTDIIVTNDDGYLLTGYEASTSFGLNDMGLLKLDANGNILWQKRVGTTDNDIATNLTELPNGHFILNGYFGQDNSLNTQVSQAVVMEFDATGNLLWTRGYFGSGRDLTYKTLPVSDGFLVMGRTNSISNSGLYDAMLLKVDATGTPVWQKQYGLDGNEDVLLTMHEMTNGEFIMGGFTRPSAQSDWDLWYHRTAANGDVYGAECLQSEVDLQDIVLSPSVANTTMISIDISQANAITSTLNDYTSACSKVCGTAGGVALGGGSNDGAQFRNTNLLSKPSLGKSKVARVSIRSKKPIEAFGFGIAIDPTKFNVRTARRLSPNLPMDIDVRTNAAGANGEQVRALGIVDFQSGAEMAACEKLTPIFEIEGVLLNALSSDGSGKLQTDLLKTEFIANETMLSPEEYEVVVDWIN